MSTYTGGGCTPSFGSAPVETDIDGQPRVAGPAIDLGSDELHP